MDVVCPVGVPDWVSELLDGKHGMPQRAKLEWSNKDFPTLTVESIVKDGGLMEMRTKKTMWVLVYDSDHPEG